MAFSNKKVQIRKLNRFNWEEAVNLELHDSQKDFLPSNLYSIAQSKFENQEAMGIFVAEEMVGFLMFGIFGAVYWLNRIMVDSAHQGKGIGSKAVELFVKMVASRPDCHEIRTSFVRQNAVAEYFFKQFGFRRIADGLEGEIVMTWDPKSL